MTNLRIDERIDLVRNKKQLRTVALLSVVLALLTIAAGFLFHREWDFSAIRLLVMAVGIFVYIVGHEAVHGALMWLFSHQKPKFGISLQYAYAGSDYRFPKKQYLIIAIAPLLVWGIVLLLLALLLPSGWFWPVWIIQVQNVSGAAGDLFMFFHILRKPDQVLIQDSGTAMTVWIA